MQTNRHLPPTFRRWTLLINHRWCTLRYICYQHGNDYEQGVWTAINSVW